MPPTTAVEADVLLDDDAGLQVDRGFDSNSPLALPTPNGVFFSHAPSLCRFRGGRLPVKATVSWPRSPNVTEGREARVQPAKAASAYRRFS